MLPRCRYAAALFDDAACLRLLMLLIMLPLFFEAYVISPFSLLLTLLITLRFL